MNRVVILLVLACAAASASAVERQVYKWTDANGVVHFSDAPPPKETQNVQSLHLIGGTSAAAPAAANAATDPAASASAPAAGATPANPAAPQDDAALCKKARENLELLQGPGAVGIAGADGKPEALDDKGREMQIATAKLTISRFCK